MTTTARIGSIISWVFGFFVIAHGVLNIVRGNDPEFGVALLLISLVYFPPATQLLKKWTGIGIHYSLKILLALLIVWVTLAVGAVNEGYWPEITGEEY